MGMELDTLVIALVKAVDDLEAVPNSVLQFCNWHAVEAMRTQVQQSWVGGEVEVPGLADLSWAYIKSHTMELLEMNRAKLHYKNLVAKGAPSDFLLFQALE